MSDNPHIIGKCIFQIDVPDQNKVELVFEQISSVGKNDLPALLSELLDAMGFPPDIQIRIDRLVLQLGDLLESRFKTDLLEGLKRALKESLGPNLPVLAVAGRGSRMEQHMALIEFFLQRGYYPWWADRKTTEAGFDSIMQELIPGGGASFSALLNRLLQKAGARQRLVRQARPDTLEQIANLFPPGAINTELAEALLFQDVLRSSGKSISGQRETLLFFLEWGRLPVGANATSEQLEAVLLQFIREVPGQARQVLLALGRKINLALRLEQQFSEAVHRAVIDLFFPSQASELEQAIMGILRAADAIAFSDISSAFVLQRTLRLLLARPEERIDIQWFSDNLTVGIAAKLDVSPGVLRQQISENLPGKTTPDSMPPKDLKADFPENEVVKQASPETPSGQTETLLFFLEWGRLPSGANASSEQLEAVLLQFILEFPQRARQVLLALGRKINLALRLEQQFSEAVHRAVIDLFFPSQGSELEQAIMGILRAADAIALSGISSTVVFHSALRLLLSRPDERIDIQWFLDNLTVGIAAKLDVLPGVLRQQISENLPGETTPDSMPPKDLKADFPENEVVKQASPETPSSQTETLLFFLEWGRLPVGANATSEQLEAVLLQFIREVPGQARQVLLALGRKINLALRLEQQFSEAVHRAVIDLFFPSQASELEQAIMGILRAADAIAFSDISSAFVLQRTLRLLLARPEERIDIQWFSDNLTVGIAAKLDVSPGVLRQQISENLPGKTTPDSMPPKDLKADFPENEVVKQASPETPSGQTETLLFFLEWGRLPSGANASSEQLEAVLLQFILEFPQRARQVLLALGRKINLALRLEQQFSEAVHRAVIDLFFPSQGSELEQAIMGILRAADAIALSDISSAFVLQRTLRLLLARPEERIDIQWFSDNLTVGIAAKLDVSPGVLRQQISENLPGETTPDSMPPKDLKADFPENEVVKQASPETPPSQTETLLFFLEWGRLPSGANASSEQLEAVLLQFILEFPQRARQVLLALGRKINLALRLEQQFSEAVHRAVIDLFFPSQGSELEQAIMGILRAADAIAFSGISSAFVLQRTLRLLLSRPDERIDIQWFLDNLTVGIAAELDVSPGVLRQQISENLPGETTPDSMPPKDLKANFPENEVVKQASPETPSSQTETLLFFLEWGRLPVGANATSEQLEAVLLQFILEFPQRARQVLLALGRKINLALRLEQQFSEAVHRAVIDLFFPSQGSELEQAIMGILRAADAIAFSGISSAFVLQRTLRLLLSRPEERIDIQWFLDNLIGEIAAELDVSPGVLRQQTSEDLPGRTTLDSIPPKDLKAGFSEDEVVKKASPETPSGQTETLLFFLEWGRLPVGANATSEQLEAVLLQFILEFPQRARQVLLALGRKINLALRLEQQFSEAVHRAVIDLFFPSQASELEQAIMGILRAADAIAFSGISSAFVLQRTLRLLLSRPEERIDIQWFLDNLIGEIAAELDVSPGVLRQQTSEDLPGETTPDSMPPKDLKANFPENEVVKQASPETPPSQTETLLFFLEWGRLPVGANATSEQLEAVLLQFIREVPGQARQVLLALGRKINLALRLEQQFSEAVHRAVIDLFFPSQASELEQAIMGILRAADAIAFSGISSTVVFQRALHILLARPEEHADIQSFSDNLIVEIADKLDLSPRVLQQQLSGNPAGESITEGSREAEVNNEFPEIQDFPERAPAMPEIPVSSQVKNLLFFLEWGRFPPNASERPEQLESVLLQFLREFPFQARPALMDLNRKINLASRLEAHFSTLVYRAVSSLFYPLQQETLEQVLEDLLRAISKIHLPGISEHFVRQIALRKLLARSGEYIDFPDFLDYLIQQIAEKLGGKPAASKKNLQAELERGPYATLTKKYLRLFANRLNKAEQAELEQVIKSWKQTEAVQSYTETTEPGDLDLILFRLSQDRAAWWDVPARPLDDLFLSLTKMPPAALKSALRQLWSPEIRSKWLPELADEVFNQILHGLWGDYMAVTALYLETVEVARSSENLHFQKTVFRETLLDAALSGRTINSSTLLRTSIRAAARASGSTEKDWNDRLIREAEAALASGAERFRRMLDLLKKETAQPASPPEPRAITPDKTEAPVSTDSPGKTPPTYLELIRLDLETVRLFFQKGAFPPGVPVPNREAMEQIIFRLSNKHPGLLQQVLRDVFRSENAVGRLLEYFTGRLWYPLGTVLLGRHFEETLSIREALFGRLNFRDQSMLDRHFFTWLFSFAASLEPGNFEPLDFTEGLIDRIAREAQMPVDQVFKLLNVANPQAPASQDIIKTMLPELKKRLQQTPETPPDIRRPKEARQMETEPEESLLIHNAGLVILAPFLPRYFTTLNMLENRVFRDDAAAERAVHLLQYLASRQTETPEHLLVFNKILCGVPLETPVPLGIDLSEEEMSLSLSLLNGVLQNWDKMKNSSIENFCGAFLLREGRLREQEDWWQLHVDSKGYDIVLDYLPWTISMVKLPWMEKRIDVTWKKKA